MWELDVEIAGNVYSLIGPNIAKVSLLFVREIDVRVCANIIIFVSVYVNTHYLLQTMSPTWLHTSGFAHAELQDSAGAAKA